MYRLERTDDDQLFLRTFWSPLPNWAIAGGVAALFAAVAAVQQTAAGQDGNDALRLVGIAAVAGYFVGALFWAIAGVAGGDVLEARFDLNSNDATIHQRLLWTWQRDWTFDLDEAEALHLVVHRGRFLFRMTTAHSLLLAFDERAPLRLGRYPTEDEARTVGATVADFLGVPIRDGPVSG